MFKLQEKYLLIANERYGLYVIDYISHPHLIEEIGRKRIEAFKLSELYGDNLSDLDDYDRNYQHIVLIDRGSNELAAALRFCNVKDIITARGVNGLYTSQLFDMDKALFDSFAWKAIEIGRLFVMPNYRDKFSPLLMLWKGIGEIYNKNIHSFDFIIGSVTFYNPEDPKADFYNAQFFYNLGIDESRANFARPKYEHTKLRLISESADNINELNKGLRLTPAQKLYARLQSKVICFAIDETYFDAYDSLQYIDIHAISEDWLEKILGLTKKNLKLYKTI